MPSTPKDQLQLIHDAQSSLAALKEGIYLLSKELTAHQKQIVLEEMEKSRSVVVEAFAEIKKKLR